jgi:hypothetical protein
MIAAFQVPTAAESVAMPAEQTKGGKPAVPVARPPKAPPPLPLPGVAADDENEAKPRWFSYESMRGWGSSVVLHSVVLLILAFRILSPPIKTMKVFDTRLAGSEMGVDEGLYDKGGLNTPITIPEAPIPTPADPPLAMLQPLDANPLEPKIAANLSGSSKPSAEGGLDNPNPGAGNGDGFGLARFGQGGEKIQGVDVKVGDPQFTLIWDNDVDLDLHVIEPGGKEIYWEDPKGRHGGELDVDNTKGYGPENIYWLQDGPEEGTKVKGPGPPGEYKWFVVYWGGFGGIPKPTKWKVRIKHDGKVTVVSGKFKALNERSKMHTLTVKPAEGVAASQANGTR